MTRHSRISLHDLTCTLHKSLSQHNTSHGSRNHNTRTVHLIQTLVLDEKEYVTLHLPHHPMITPEILWFAAVSRNDPSSLFGEGDRGELQCLRGFLRLKPCRSWQEENIMKLAKFKILDIWALAKQEHLHQAEVSAKKISDFLKLFWRAYKGHQTNPLFQSFG
jgi:hypothetical protein